MYPVLIMYLNSRPLLASIPGKSILPSVANSGPLKADDERGLRRFSGKSTCPAQGDVTPLRKSARHTI